jgi:hypothetical protein
VVTNLTWILVGTSLWGCIASSLRRASGSTINAALVSTQKKVSPHHTMKSGKNQTVWPRVTSGIL